MFIEKIKIKAIHSNSGYIKRNHIHIGSILELHHKSDNFIDLYMNNKFTGTTLTSRELGKLKKSMEWVTI